MRHVSKPHRERGAIDIAGVISHNKPGLRDGLL